MSDQSFPANVPAADSGECLRVMRVEDGSLHELTSELLQVLKRMVIPGMVIMLGSLSQLGKYGTAWYAGEWIKNRNLLRRELGDVLVVPLLPFVRVSGVGSHVVRSLLELSTCRIQRWSCSGECGGSMWQSSSAQWRGDSRGL